MAIGKHLFGNQQFLAWPQIPSAVAEDCQAMLIVPGSHDPEKMLQR